MADSASIKKDIAWIKNPNNIVDATYASSAYVLRLAMDRDPTVQRLLKSGKKTHEAIENELKKNSGKLDEMTLACFAYLIENAEQKRVIRCLKGLYKQAVKDPGPFFVQFAAHALRKAIHLTTIRVPKDMEYTRGEQLDISEKL